MNRTRKQIAKFGCLPVAIIVGIAIAMGGGDSDDSKADTKPAAKPPAYSVVKQDKDGNQRQVIVEVDTTKDLRAVFDAVTDDLKADAGYYVWINCSTGGTAKMDNRLANGRYAVGHMGSVVTGMDEGDTEFTTNDDRSCPAKG
jgi:hypothetical protein